MMAISVSIALAMMNPTAGSHAVASQAFESDSDLSAETLAAGRKDQAIRELEAEIATNPDDPALLINLGIAYAQQGDNAKAEHCFKAALMSEDRLELETASGETMDSRKLARVALAMLDQGQFRATSRTALKE